MPEQRDVFSDQSFAIQITLRRSANALPTVRQVLIGHRPAGLYGSSDKSHLVPWLSFCDGLRADVVGQTMPDAIVRVAQLIDWTAGLPSQPLADCLRRKSLAELRKATRKVEKGVDDDSDGDGETQVRTPSVWHGLADEHALAMGGVARAYASQWRGPRGPEDTEVQILQNVIAACLHHRNTVPLAAVSMPDPLGPPTDAANRVRGWEATFAADPDTVIAPSDQATLVKALWGLLDVKAMEYLAANPELVMDAESLKADPKPAAKAKGQDAGPDWEIDIDNPTVDPAALPAFVVADHVLTMEQVYPHCCAKTNFRTTVGAVLSDGLAHLAFGKVATAGQRGITHGSRKLRDAPGPVVVSDNNMDVDAGGTSEYEGFAVQLELGGSGTISRMYLGHRPRSGKGRHCTAWVALCDYTRRMVSGITVAQVAAALDHERQAINKMAASLHYPNPVMPPRPGPTATLADAQLKIGEFLSDLNSMPGAITDTGGNSPGARENILRATIKSGYAQLSDLLELLDPASMSFEYDDKADMVHGLALRTVLHMYMVGTAYPDVAASVGLVSEQALAAVLFPVGVPDDIAGLIGALVMNCLRPTAAFDQKTYRQTSTVTGGQRSA